jgi:hypothetical protein
MPAVAVADDLDYLVTLARLCILDALAGPEPETPADLKRKQDRDKIERHFPRSSPEEPGVPIGALPLGPKSRGP